MEVLCSSSDEDNNSGSNGHGALNNSDQGAEPAVDSLTVSGSHELNEGTVSKSSSSFSIKCHDQDERPMKATKATELDETHGSPLQTSAEVDVDESDVEEDVKVCDICGDAGREDLLAVCSRCSDGAEHTYCMREMLDKVPEVDWFCEECKLSEQLEERMQENCKMLGTYERSRSLGRTSSINCDVSVKVDSKDPICERGKMKNVKPNSQVPSKRCRDSCETGPTTKRQALESWVGSPTSSNPNRVTLLSKDNSLKNLEKVKGKPTNQIVTGTETAGDSSEIARPLITASFNASKGNFVKSSSFSSGNAKLNVKVSDEDLQKQKQGVDAKHGPAKLITKSMSFKGLGRSIVSEPKVKMLSPKCAPIQEMKAQKQGRDRNSFERKSTIKLDNSFPGQMATIASKRPSRGDNIQSLPVLNNRDYKNSQPEEKLATFSKHICNSVPKFSDATANIGGARADVPDGQNEKLSENSFSRSRQGANGGSVSVNRGGLSVDASGSRTKEGIHEENRLKAAIEAAMQKKQDIYKKSRIHDKPNDLSTTNIQGNHVGDVVVNLSTDNFSDEGMHDGDVSPRNHVFNSCKKTTIGGMRQLKVYPTDCTTSPVGESVLSVSAIPEQESVWQGGFEIHRSGKFPDTCGGFQAHLSSIASNKVVEAVKKFPQKIVLDEVPRPCAWPVQFKENGAREDNIALYFFAKDLESYLRSYKILLEYLMKHDLVLRGNINGVELLVCPSNHLPDKSQCWNTLLFMWGVFRGGRQLCPDKRLGSLEMPEISTSNFAPLDKVAASSACLANSGLHWPAKENLSVSSTSDPVLSKHYAPASVVNSTLQQSGSVCDGKSHNQTCFGGRTCLISQTSTVNNRKRPEIYSVDSGARACCESETSALKDHCNHDPNLVMEHQQSTSEIDRGDHVIKSQNSSSYIVQDRQHILWGLVDKQDVGGVVRPGGQVADTVDNIYRVKSDNGVKSEQGWVDNMKNNGNELKLEDDLKQENSEMDSIRNIDCGKLKVECSVKLEDCVDINNSLGSNSEKLDCLQFSPKRQSHIDPASSNSQAASVIRLQKRSWMDGKDSLEGRDQISRNKGMKGGDAFDGCDLYRFPSSAEESVSACTPHGVRTSPQMEDTSKNVGDEKQNCTNSGSMEGYILLVDSHPAQLLRSQDESLPWKVALSENEDRLPDGSPNLELALGVEKKQLRSDISPGFGSKDPEMPSDIRSSREEDEDASASLSLSLSFPFSDRERPRVERPPTNVEQTLHEVNTSLLLFRGSSHK